MESLAENAHEQKSHMQYSLLTPLQFLSLSKEHNEVVNDLKLQVHTMFYPIHMSHVGVAFTEPQ